MDELLTYRDEATGERVGLPATEVGRWSAATAALLTDECGLGPGATAGVLLPPHWQTAVVLLGAWSAGLKVSFRGWSTAGLSPAGPALDVSFVAHSRIGSWLDEIPTARFPFELFHPAADPCAGYRDLATAASAHLGAAAPASPPGPHAAAAPDGTTFGSYGAIAAEMAHRHGIAPGDRVLVDTATSEQPLIWLLAPLSAGACVVLADSLDPVRRDSVIASEKITHILA
jgi:uncharacterized protein (TIGR03089 family)